MQSIHTYSLKPVTQCTNPNSTQILSFFVSFNHLIPPNLKPSKPLPTVHSSQPQGQNLRPSPDSNSTRPSRPRAPVHVPKQFGNPVPCVNQDKELDRFGSIEQNAIQDETSTFVDRLSVSTLQVVYRTEIPAVARSEFIAVSSAKEAKCRILLFQISSDIRILLTLFQHLLPATDWSNPFCEVQLVDKDKLKGQCSCTYQRLDSNSEWGSCAEHGNQSNTVRDFPHLTILHAPAHHYLPLCSE